MESQAVTASESAPTPSAQSSSLFRNAAWMAWSGAISIANSIVLWAVVARWRTPEELGRFTIVMSVGTIFIMLCSLGLGPYLTSEIARRKQRHAFIASATGYLLAWSAVCAVAMIATGFAVSDSAEVHLAIAILSLALLPTGLISIAEPVFTAAGRSRVIAQATTVENLLRTIVPLVVLARGYGLPWVFAVLVLGRLMACAIYALVARGHLAALRQAQWPLVREIARHTPTFAGVTVLATLHWQMAAVLAGKLGGEAVAAQFGVASRVMIPVSVLLASFATVIQPAASRLAAVSLSGLGEFLSRNVKLVLALALPMAVGILLLGRDALTLVFGPHYASAALPLSLLSISIIPFSLVMITARGLVATGKQQIDLLGNAAAVAANLAFNLLLIPRYGATGAAIAQLLSVTILAAVEVGYATRRLFRLELLRALVACAWPLALMTLVVWQARHWGLWGAVATGGAVYLGCLWLTRRDLRFGS
jgi:O-antigen/teichoic acid export membrane protein